MQHENAERRFPALVTDESPLTERSDKDLDTSLDPFESILDKLGRLESQNNAIARSIALTTPFYFESDRDDFIKKISTADIELKNLESKINHLKTIVNESYPVYSFVQRMIILWFSFWSRGLDEMRIKQLWTYPNTNRNYTELCNKLLGEISKNRKRVEKSWKFAKDQLASEYSQNKKAELLTQKLKFMEDNLSFVNFINKVGPNTYMNIEQFGIPSFLLSGPTLYNFSDWKHLTKEVSAQYLRITKVTPPDKITKEVMTRLIIDSAKVLTAQLKEFNRKISEIDGQIYLEVEKILIEASQ